MWQNPQETEDLVTFTEENFIFCPVFVIQKKIQLNIKLIILPIGE